MTKLAIFDLDGTLLNTVEDLGNATNYALEQCGFPIHPKDEYYQMVGRGIYNLFRAAIPSEYATEDNVQRMASYFIPYYDTHKCDCTRPYDGIPEMLKTITDRGVRLAVAKSRNSHNTKICCTRYGNVMCSRGSVIPLWIEQIRSGNPITLTEPKMTRFIMSLEEAVDLVLFAFEHGHNGDILVQKAPACTIQTQAEAVCDLFGGRKEDIKVIGIRHGEKMYETLLTKEECAKAEDMGNFYRVPADNRDLNYDQYFTKGDVKRATIDEFNSDNAYRLNLEETIAKIGALEYIQNELNGVENLAK